MAAPPSRSRRDAAFSAFLAEHGSDPNIARTWLSPDGIVVVTTGPVALPREVSGVAVRVVLPGPDVRHHRMAALVEHETAKADVSDARALIFASAAVAVAGVLLWRALR